jgi:uncharacterized hydrophobic protein (TIGR00271 family)
VTADQSYINWIDLLPMNQTTPTVQKPFHILTAVSSSDDFLPLLYASLAIAEPRAARLTILTVHGSAQSSDWFVLPETLPATATRIEIEAMHHNTPSAAILERAQTLAPDLLVLGWQGRLPKGRYMMGSTLDPVLYSARCDVIVVKSDEKWKSLPTNGDLRILVPTAGGPNTHLSLDLALATASAGKVTVMYVMPTDADPANIRERYSWLSELIAPWSNHPDINAKIVQADSVTQGVISEANNHHLALLGATKENIFSQLMFGAIPQKIAIENQGPTILVKKSDNDFGSVARRLWWRSTKFLPRLSIDERMEAYKQIRRSARPKVDFFMMIGLASGIAALGLLLDSPAVIIGAMLVAPLMSAIIGIGLAIIQADPRLLGLATSATLRGVLLAILMGLIIGLALFPFTEPTHEILARTRPSLFDLGVAIISGLAGAYAICRRNMSASLPGVAIAVALVPPLATVGIGLSWMRWDIAGGALLLFLTNLVSIVAASGLVFFLMGFRPDLQRGRRLFSTGVVGSVILLALMAWVLWSVSYETLILSARQRAIDAALETHLVTIDPPVELIEWFITEETAENMNLDVEVRSSRPSISYRDIIAVQSQIADDLTKAAVLTTDQTLTLAFLIVPRTVFSAQNPPTPTPTSTPSPEPTEALPVVEAVEIASPTPPPTETAVPVATATITPVPPTLSPTPRPTQTASATHSPTATATPTQTYTPTPVIVVVTGTGGQGVKLRWAPSGAVAGAFSEGSVLQMGYEEQVVDGVTWVNVTDVEGRNGWVAATYLTALR